LIVIKRSEADVKALQGVLIVPDDLKDDGTVYLGVKIPKPWGHEIEKYRDENSSIWLLTILPNQETSMHCHPNKTTLLLVTGGTAVLSTLTARTQIGAGDVVVIEKGAFHRTGSAGDMVVLYELESPPNKRDLVRLDDAYGRGQGYEFPCAHLTP
jgi:mannose-6-phosphate isomerase-like protein (cupin superfamily)